VLRALLRVCALRLVYHLAIPHEPHELECCVMDLLPMRQEGRGLWRCGAVAAVFQNAAHAICGSGAGMAPGSGPAQQYQPTETRNVGAWLWPARPAPWNPTLRMWMWDESDMSSSSMVAAPYAGFSGRTT
jgi:hypothetical protein